MRRYTVTFVTDLDARKVGNGDTHEWVLLAPLAVRVDEHGGESVPYVAPAGFRTDFATVPRLFYAVAGDTAHKSSVLHDYLLRARLAGWATAGDIFLAAMAAEGVAAWRRVLMWAAVRAAARFLG